MSDFLTLLEGFSESDIVKVKFNGYKIIYEEVKQSNIPSYKKKIIEVYTSGGTFMVEYSVENEEKIKKLIRSTFEKEEANELGYYKIKVASSALLGVSVFVYMLANIFDEEASTLENILSGAILCVQPEIFISAYKKYLRIKKKQVYYKDQDLFDSFDRTNPNHTKGIRKKDMKRFEAKLVYEDDFTVDDLNKCSCKTIKMIKKNISSNH